MGCDSTVSDICDNVSNLRLLDVTLASCVFYYAHFTIARNYACVNFYPAIDGKLLFSETLRYVIFAFFPLELVVWKAREGLEEARSLEGCWRMERVVEWGAVVRLRMVRRVSRGAPLLVSFVARSKPACSGVFCLFSRK